MELVMYFQDKCQKIFGCGFIHYDLINCQAFGYQLSSYYKTQIFIYFDLSIQNFLNNLKLANQQILTLEQISNQLRRCIFLC
ncbi:unnamed protein product (macronuclear) [Paramecium tetraurelia]|uniref:Uncharacterized protein n=1 Tax=Paramecium tetraurelia TaxID=5888 RepID=A0EH00_PARTE|nr:uncharacterized protein GSPATT00026915001 [Paramecium tetraurelia]CAK94591.1 unnamed protein product [Paramecium tetraurelia]|eukprot:XP_001461964.1 hypothetical protein (macronuclear) [Paramecium tetraurelia strain d4-2]